MKIAAKTRHDMAKAFGFKLRSSLDADFISYPQGASQQYGTDDVARIDNNGKIFLYVHDAQVALAAEHIAAMPK